MTTTIVRIKGNKRELKARIRNLPRYIAGTLPDTLGIGRVWKAYFAAALWQKIHEGFLVKSDGGTDELGTKWKPLTQATIAQRPLRPGEKKQLGIKRNENVRGLLTPAQDKLWKGIFATTFRRLIAKGYSLGEAKAKAGQLAWSILKAQGAKTKLEVLGKRKVPIGIVDGTLLEATEPGTASVAGYSPPENQTFVSRRGGVELGLKRKYMNHFHEKRPIWPKAYKIGPWTRYASRKALQAVVDLLATGQSLTRR